MENILLTKFSASDIKNIILESIAEYFEKHQTKSAEVDEIGGVEFASEITGKKIPTIYNLVSARKIPHSKQGKQLYFSKFELLEWLRSGKRKTTDEIAIEAENFTPKTKRNRSSLTNR